MKMPDKPHSLLTKDLKNMQTDLLTLNVMYFPCCKIYYSEGYTGFGVLYFISMDANIFCL